MGPEQLLMLPKNTRIIKRTDFIGITRIIPFYRIRDEPIITNKLIIIMAVIAVIKVIILFTWR